MSGVGGMHGSVSAAQWWGSKNSSENINVSVSIHSCFSLLAIQCRLGEVSLEGPDIL